MDTPSSRKVPNFTLRSADESDYRFTKKLYIRTMKPLLTILDAWDETDMINKFNGHYKLAEVQVILVDGKNVGWLQICETEQEFELAQIHIEHEFCSQGIGTQLIRKLMNEAKKKGKPVCLSVVRGNPALSLYQRLRFSIIGEDAHKLHMRWDSD